MTLTATETAAGAVLSADERYRYRLWRRWGSGPLMAFIGLNPSTADARRDDQTIRQMCFFARREGASGIDVGNLAALRSPHPDVLAADEDPVGRDNEAHLLDIISTAGTVVVAWGAHSFAASRAGKVQDLAARAGQQLYCLGVTASGAPRHPCRLAHTTRLLPWP